MWPWRVIGGEPGTHRDTRAAPGPPAWPELPTELLLLGPVGTIPVPPAAAPAKGTGTAMGTRWAEASPELWGADRDLRHGHSCPQLEQSRAVPSCAAPGAHPVPPVPTAWSSAVPHPDSRSRPHRASALCPWRGRRRGGQRNPCFVSPRGAPGPAPQCGPCSAPAPGVPVNVCSGPGCPQQEEGDKPGDTSAARVTPLPWNSWLCPQLLASGPQTPSPPRQGWPCRWPRPREHERGTRSRFPVILGRINQAGDRCGAAAAADE